jgi:hypothetical protein
MKYIKVHLGQCKQSINIKWSESYTIPRPLQIIKVIWGLLLADFVNAQENRRHKKTVDFELLKYDFAALWATNHEALPLYNSLLTPAVPQLTNSLTAGEKVITANTGGHRKTVKTACNFQNATLHTTNLICSHAVVTVMVVSWALQTGANMVRYVTVLPYQISEHNDSVCIFFNKIINLAVHFSQQVNQDNERFKLFYRIIRKF